MKNWIGSVFCAALTFVLFLPQTTSAGPVTFVANRTAHFVHKAGVKIDQHVIQPTERHVIRPARRAIINHMPRG